jgi:alpha-galactosidase
MHSITKSTVLFLLLFAAVAVHAQKFDGLATRPPLGWNSWNTFATNINEQLVKDIADLFVKSGLKDAGYEYIVLDDGWMAKERDAQGNLIADPVKFPNGMKAVADYVHGKGLKFGLYNCAGNKTCAGYPGSRGHEYQDARLYATWGVDFLKYDWCGAGKMNAEEAYTTMRDALYAAKRPVVFSICEWGDNQPWNWATPVGHLWRITGDISNCWNCEEGHGSWSSWGVLRILDMRKGIRKVSGPGHWNDFDMMEIGNGMSVNEDRAHFALWSMMASPLIMGNDLRSASRETMDILENKEVIAVNQDSLGIQAMRALDENGDLDVWVKPLSNGDWAVCFLNRSELPYTLNFDWNEHHITEDISGRSIDTKGAAYQLRDLFQHKNIGTTKETLKTVIPVHDVLMLRLKKS